MNNQKTGNTLNLALDATSREREASMNLNAGYEKETQRWKLIIRYFGAASELETDEIVVTPLLGNYGIADIPQDQIEGFAQNPAIEYIEAPKRLYFAAYEGRQTSCVNPVQNQSPYLFGKGILIACIDSGVDYTHPDFRNEDGSTRILRLWDQSIPGNPPKGYRIGSEYTQEQINRALEANTMAEREALVPSIDTSGHGTAVLGIAAGNGRESQGTERGVAPESSLLVVKLGIREPNGFPRTTELMQGVDYAIRTAQELQMPVVINLSFGNSYRKKQFLKDLNRITRCLEIYLGEFVEGIKPQVKLPDIEKLDINCVLSFNYTHTYERLYDLDKSKRVEYDYIHGEIRKNSTFENCNLILGIDEYLEGEEKTKANEFIQFKKFYQRIYKRTGCKYVDWIKTNEEWLKRYSKVKTSENNIYILGHSLDITDGDILSRLINMPHTRTTIFYHNQESLGNQISNLVKILGEDELISMVHGENAQIVFKEQQKEVAVK